MSSKLLTLVVIVLGILAVAQLVRLYELSSKLRNRREEDIPNRDNKLNANLLFAFMFLLHGSFIWLLIKFGWTGRGEAASTQGETIDWLFNINMIIITAVFFLTNTLLFTFVKKYIRKPGVTAYYYPHNNTLELIWTVVPAIVLAFIIILGLKSWNEFTGKSTNEAVVVELFSKQFDWTARYAGVDNKLGKFDYKLTTDKNELGLLTTEAIEESIQLMEVGAIDSASMQPTILGIKYIEQKLNDPKLIMVPSDREAMVNDLSRKEHLVRLLHQMKNRHNSDLDKMTLNDVIQKDTLHLLVGQEYEFNFRSKDVIHSAFFPHFRAQMNTVPGLTTRMKLVPTITTNEMREKMNNPKFNYALLCNKICGGAHYKMKMIVVVHSPESYYNFQAGKTDIKGDAWVKEDQKSKLIAKYEKIANSVKK